MITGLDHIVIVVRDLENAIRDYTRLGFTVVRGGRHAGIGTENALIAFADSSYMELIAFTAAQRSNNHWWYAALRSGGGIVDFCVRTDHLEADVDGFRKAGAEIGKPFAMSRERPDGFLLRWELAATTGPSRGVVPFLIRDITPRDERVPSARIHQNGVVGVKRLEIGVAQTESIAQLYRRHVRGIRVDPSQASRIHIGRHEIRLHPATFPLTEERPSQIEAVLGTSSGARSILDPSQTQGARIVLEDVTA